VIVRASTPDQRRIAVSYIADRCGLRPEDVARDDLFDVFLSVRGEDARGAVLYRNYASGDVEMLCAGEPGWVTPGLLKFVLSYPFRALGCQRVTCLAHRKNKAMRNYLERMGFRLEGVKRKALDGADLMIYGLLDGESKWR
jgi:hypothetical protein